MLSESTVEYIQNQKKEAKEAEMWANIESQIEAEEAKKRELEMIQKQKQQLAGKPLDKFESVNIWNKLGISTPSISANDSVDSLKSDGSKSDSRTPDLILEKMISKLSEPVEGVPSAPDLEELSRTDQSTNYQL